MWNQGWFVNPDFTNAADRRMYGARGVIGRAPMRERESILYLWRMVGFPTESADVNGLMNTSRFRECDGATSLARTHEPYAATNPLMAAAPDRGSPGMGCAVQGLAARC